MLLHLAKRVAGALRFIFSILVVVVGGWLLLFDWDLLVRIGILVLLGIVFIHELY